VSSGFLYIAEVLSLVYARDVNTLNLIIEPRVNSSD